jgi:hypothetical protein
MCAKELELSEALAADAMAWRAMERSRILSSAKGAEIMPPISGEASVMLKVCTAPLTQVYETSYTDAEQFKTHSVEGPRSLRYIWLSFRRGFVDAAVVCVWLMLKLG